MSSPPASRCLDEFELLDLADGVPSAELRARAEAHIDGCTSCREQLAAFLRARAPSSASVNTAQTTTPSTEAALPGSPRSLPPTLARGTLLGRYVVLERIGAGGMGVVYAAYDPSIDRRIVLKLLRADSHATGAAERRLQEAQAAARTQHPNVVAVHDVGTFEEFVFIAMELVDGGTLRQHLAAARPPWREVVRLYLQAGRGLAAAHAAGVVHRDFKPDNVLVDRTGRVRVTDFGLARMAPSPIPSQGDFTPAASLQPAPADGAPRTALAGTPGYIPPEVLARRPADARSDQYSFCVALYEGLYGARPSSAEAQAAVARSSIPRAVQAVIARGLALEPGDRHPSMEALLEALERAAFPRRKRQSIAAASVGLVALCVGIFFASRPSPCPDPSPRLTGIWDTARSEALRRAFMASGAPTAASLHTAASRTLDAYAVAWRESHRDACEATRVRGEQSEAALDLRMRCLERRRRELGALADVLLVADTAGVLRAPEAAQALNPLASCADVEALSRPMLPPERPDVAPRVEAAFEQLADARARLHAGRWKEAAERASAVATEAEALAYKPLLGEALLLQAMALKDLREEQNASATLRRAVLASLAGRDDMHAIEALVQLVHSEGDRATRPEQAEFYREQARALLERVGGDPRLESQLLHSQGNTLMRQGQLTEALPLLQQALALREKVYGHDSVELHAVLNTLGDTLKLMGRIDEALEHLRRSQALLEKAYGPEHPRTAVVLNNQGTVLVAAKRFEEALACQRESLARLERAHGPGQPVGYVLALLGNMGAIQFDRGHVKEAEPLTTRAWRLAREHLPQGHPTRMTIGNNLSLLLLESGRPKEALALLEELRADQKTAQAEGRRAPVYARTFANEADVLIRMGQFERAIGAARQAVAMLREQGAEAEQATLLPVLARAQLGVGQLSEAQRTAQQAVEIHQRLAGAGHPPPPELQHVLGEVLLARGDAAGARAALEQALEAWEKAGANPVILAPVRFDLARALHLERMEPARVRALANAAREALASTPEPRRVKLADIDAFLRRVN